MACAQSTSIASASVTGVRAVLLCAAGLIMLLVVGAVDAAAATNAEDASSPPPAPPLWRLSDDDTDIWLFATYYAPPADMPWRSDDVARAVDAAETIWFEADAEAPGAQARVTGTMREEGFRGDGPDLTALLGEDGAGLIAIAEALGLNPEALQTMRPWQAHLILTVSFIASHGAEPGAGVEKALLNEARARGRNLRYLRTIDQQLANFTGLAPQEEAALLRATIRHWSEQSQTFDAVGTAWREGDLAALDGFLNAPMREAAPAAYQALIVDLNRLWADKIERLTADRGQILIAAPAAHFVGPDSILEQLRARGYDAVRVGAPPPLDAKARKAAQKAAKKAEKEKRKAARKAEKEARRHKQKEERP